MNPETLCMGCMRDKGDARVCSTCGFEEGTPPERPGQLWPRTILADKYVVGRVLGQGGFGITYLAWDLLLDRKLAIKEHYPREICTRSRDERTLQPLTRRLSDDYRYGLRKFVEEGRAMACFYDHPGIVLLLDFFEANGTAYIVMAYVAGMTFKQYLQNHGGKIDFGPALDILTPVMDALREVHRMGMLHRDVAPDNIYINEKKEVKILDFGSTRYAVREFSQVPAVKAGYSPIEQYGQAGKQGTWTDVYGTAATLYRAVTGQIPPEAPDRLEADPLIPPSRLGIEIPPASEKALLKALSVQARDRFQTMDHFWNALVPNEPRPSPDRNGSNGAKWSVVWLVAACVLLLSTVSFAAMWLHARTADRYNASESSILRDQLQHLQNTLTEQQKSLDDQRTQGNNLQAQDNDLQAKANALQSKVNALAQQNQLLNNGLASTKTERDALTNERDSLKQQLRSAASDNDNLKARINTLTRNLQEQQSAHAISVAKFGLYNWDGKNKPIGAPSSDFASNALRYLLVVLQGPNPLLGKQAFSAALSVRFIAPDGTLKSNPTAGIQSTKDEPVWSTTSGWGSDKPGSFRPVGNWRVEVWYEGQKIKELPFRVH